MGRVSKINSNTLNKQPQLTLKELRHVWLLHRSLSFKQAAADAGISQSALSQSISNIEQRLRVPLFNRNKRNVHPTSFGGMIANQAESVLNIMEDMLTQIDDMRDSREGSVAFGMGIFAANHLLDPVMKHASQYYPDIQLRASVAHIRELQEQFLRGEIQFFVAGRDPQFRIQTSARALLYREQLVVACRPGHPLLDESPVNSVDLIRYPAITYDGSYLRRQIYQQLSDTNEFDLLERNCPAVAIQQPWLLADFVQTSDYVLIASQSALQDWLSDGRLVTVKVTDLDMAIDMELTHRGKGNMSPAHERIIEVINQVVKSQHLSK